MKSKIVRQFGHALLLKLFVITEPTLICLTYLVWVSVRNHASVVCMCDELHRCAFFRSVHLVRARTIHEPIVVTVRVYPQATFPVDVIS